MTIQPLKPEALEKVLADLEMRKTNGSEYEKKNRPFLTRITKKTFHLFYKDDVKTIDRDECASCGICEKVCPVDNLSKIGRSFVIGKSCEDCGACAQWCPQKAVHFGKRNAEGKRAYTHSEINLKDMIVQKSGSL